MLRALFLLLHIFSHQPAIPHNLPIPLLRCPCPSYFPFLPPPRHHSPHHNSNLSPPLSLHLLPVDHKRSSFSFPFVLESLPPPYIFSTPNDAERAYACVPAVTTYYYVLLLILPGYYAQQRSVTLFHLYATSLPLPAAPFDHPSTFSIFCRGQPIFILHHRFSSFDLIEQKWPISLILVFEGWCEYVF